MQIYICIYIYLYLYIQHTHTYHMCIYVYIDMIVYAHKYTYMFAYVYMYIHVFVCIYSFLYVGLLDCLHAPLSLSLNSLKPADLDYPCLLGDTAADDMSGPCCRIERHGGPRGLLAQSPCKLLNRQMALLGARQQGHGFECRSVLGSILYSLLKTRHSTKRNYIGVSR